MGGSEGQSNLLHLAVRVGCRREARSDENGAGRVPRAQHVVLETGGRGVRVDERRRARGEEGGCAPWRACRSSAELRAWLAAGGRRGGRRREVMKRGAVRRGWLRASLVVVVVVVVQLSVRSREQRAVVGASHRRWGRGSALVVRSSERARHAPSARSSQSLLPYSALGRCFCNTAARTAAPAAERDGRRLPRRDSGTRPPPSRPCTSSRTAQP